MLFKNKIKSNFGFTLIELIMVMGIIAGLAGLFLTSYPASQRRARDASRQSDVKQYQTLMEAYAASHNNMYFIDTGDISDNCTTLGLGVNQCKDDSAYHYQIISTETSYVIWARMEQRNDSGTVQYFVVCSNGISGMTTTIPTACPF